jgi:hypothetical protein
MNRKNGYGMVTTSGLICVDHAGRTARHLEGDIRIDYMCENHFWVIVKNVAYMGDSFPNTQTRNLAENGPHELGEIWIPDHMVASIRWFKQEW